MNTARSVKNVEIAVSDAINLAAHCHYTGEKRYGSALICPAMGVTAKFYEPFARHLCEQGFDVLSFDYSGIGLSRSGSLRGQKSTMKAWAESDIDASLQWIKNNLQAGPLVIVGHSAGGQLVGVTNSNIHIDAMLLICSQSGYWRHWKNAKRIRLLIFWYVFMPLLSNLFGYFPARLFSLGEDLPKGVALQWARWCRSVDYMASDRNLAVRFSRYQGPILSYGFGDDGFAPKSAVHALLECYSNAKIKHIHIEPDELGITNVGHFGFFRERIAKTTLWIDSVEWLKATTKAN